jgi:hypothetical protein
MRVVTLVVVPFSDLFTLTVESTLVPSVGVAP